VRTCVVTLLASVSVTVKVSETAEPLTVPEMTPVDARG